MIFRFPSLRRPNLTPNEVEAARGAIVGSVIGLVLGGPVGAVLGGGLSAALLGFFGRAIDRALLTPASSSPEED